MAEQNNKDQKGKTLTIKSGTLGLSKDATNKLAINTSTEGSSRRSTFRVHNTSHSGVVVVTKNRSGKNSQNEIGSDGLTNAEREARLQALQQAESHRKIEEERKLQQEKERQLLEELRLQERIKQEQHQRDLEEHQRNLEAQRQQEEQKKALEMKKMFLSKGKIRNLNMIKTASSSNIETIIEPAKDVATIENEILTPVAIIEEAKQHHDTKKKQKAAEEEAERANLAKLNKAFEEKKFNKKFSVSQVMMMDPEDESFRRGRSLASMRRAKEKAKRKYEENMPREKILREVILPDFITIQELAARMSEKAADVIKALMKMGMMVTLNQSIDADTAELIVSEFGHKVKRVTAEDIEKALLQEVEDSDEDLIPRPPVVTIMGHVDHGKTSLLDALRSTDVAAGEAGGITQHIGAYQVTLVNGQSITFLDTPGHEAFTAMRLRGAQVTDIVILVVAADDGIMAQTVEAINHAKAANVPIIVAINKIDKPGADTTRVKNELLSHGLVAEDMGGETIVVEVSAKQRLNLEVLEESILIQAEMLRLRANPNRLAKGIVIEAQVDKGRGPVATLLVQSGTLKSGDMVVAGKAFGRVKTLNNDKGKRIDEALPSIPVELLGLNEAPIAGDEFIATVSEKSAKDIASFRLNREKERALVSSRKATLEQMFLQAKNSGFKEFNVIVKADVQGSVEAISSTLLKLATEEISVKIIHSGVGGITESDITLATASNAFIIGFNVRANNLARDLARKNGVEIRYYAIIYNLVDDVKAAMSGMLSPTLREEITGYAEVKQVFDLTKFGVVAGSYITEGIIKRNCHARLIRDNVVIYNGKLKALKRFKEDVREVRHGFECGISFENYEDLKPGDRIEAYDIIEEQRTL